MTVSTAHVRLHADEQAALATIATKIASPIRRAPSTADCVRAAILYAASSMQPGDSTGTI